MPSPSQSLSPTAHKPGDLVYDVHGNAYSYIGRCGNGHAVEAVYEQDDEGPYYAEPQSLHEVFSTPPRQKLAEDLTELHADIAARREELSGLHREIAAVQQEKRAVAARAKADPQLLDLHLWLENKVTHIVSLEYYGFSIGTVEQVLRTTDRDRELRLMSLMVDPKANRFWVGYSAYSDGSSSQTRCLLATSLEHARERAAEYIQNEIKRDRSGDHGALAAAAIKYDIPISDELRKQAEERKVKAAQNTLDHARKAVERAQAELAVAEAQAKATGAPA